MPLAKRVTLLHNRRAGGAGHDHGRFGMAWNFRSDVVLSRHTCQAA
jgi:hypothetical protein